ncbi:hypothetical protein [Kitasatospora sp. NPDC097643]|uniref:hypothetical protein n=1 Tax=Kitasatospora sp. NPDC097643 TaxID=3157230 RepID=UPI00331EE8DC
MTHRIARSIAGALVALLAAVGLTAAASSATAVAAPRPAAAAGTTGDGAVGGGTTAVQGAVVQHGVRSAVESDRSGAVAQLAAKTKEKKKGFFAKLGKFVLVVVLLIILLFVLLIVGIVYAAKRIFSRRK